MHLWILAILLIMTQPLMARKVALVFGTNYKGNTAGIPPLDQTENDARNMSSVLKTQGKFDEVVTVLGNDVTTQRMEKEFNRVAKSLRKGDTFFFYFSGHGTYARDASAPNGLQNSMVMYSRPHVTDKMLSDWMDHIKADQKVATFDICYSGGFVQKGKHSKGLGDVPMAEGQQGAVIVDGHINPYFKDSALVSSSDANETSLELSGGGINGGIFTHWFSKGFEKANGDMDGNNIVTLLEAYEWSSKRVTKMARRFKHDQHPQVAGKADNVALVGNLKIPEEQEEPSIVDLIQETEDNVVPVEETDNPVEPVIPEQEGDVNKPSGTVVFYTTILESVHAGYSKMDPKAVLRRNKMKDRARQIRVLVDEKDVKVDVEWLSERQLQSETGEQIPLGKYTFNGKIKKNRVAKITVKDIPAGIQALQIRAEGYPVIVERLGVEKNNENASFVVASLDGYGSIQGRVFLKNFDTPLKGQTIWMPTVTGINQVHKVDSQTDGSFWFLNLPPAKNYYIKPSFQETTPLDNRTFEVKSGGVTRVDVVLNQKFR